MLQHWIRLEICADILIYSLKMKVEPSDTSYMPKLVKISAGNAFTELKELAVVSIHPRDTIVTLLSDVREVRRMKTINKIIILLFFFFKEI